MVGLIRDVAHQWQSILLIAIAAALLAVSIGQYRYAPTYTSKTVLYVTGSGNSTVYQDLYSSTQVAPKLTEILNSRVLKHKVAEEIGLSDFVGTAEAESVEQTNFVVLRVTTSSPDASFREMKAILENYDSVTEYVLDGVILKVLEPPWMPTAPDRPISNADNGAIGFLIATVLMVALLAFLSYRRDTIRSEGDIEEKLDTTMLASIPHETKYHTLKEKIRREKKSILLTDPAVTFRYTEAMDRLARRVKIKMDEKNAKIVLVCSVMENEGKSSVAANLALALSKQGEKVLLLDGDLKKPSQYKIMGFSNEPFVSLGDVLTGKSSMNGILRRVPNSGLYCVFNKNIIGNSSEVLTSANIHKVLSVMKEHSDYIVMDTSPMALVADAEDLITLVDSAILVVRQNLVEAEQINDAIDGLNASGDKLLGCVFNDVYPEYLGGFDSYSYHYKQYEYGGAG